MASVAGAANEYPRFPRAVLYSEFRDKMPHFCGKLHSTRVRTLTYETPKAMPPLWAEPTRAEIAQLAYSYWEQRGRTHGTPWEDWFRAEKELIERRKRLLR